MAVWSAISDVARDLFDYNREYVKDIGSAIISTPRNVKNAYRDAALATRGISYFPTKRKAIKSYKSFITNSGQNLNAETLFSGVASMGHADPDVQSALDVLGTEMAYLNDVIRHGYDMARNGARPSFSKDRTHNDMPYRVEMFFRNKKDLMHAKKVYKIARDYLREIPLTDQNSPFIGSVMEAYDRLNDAVRFLDRKRDTDEYRENLRTYGYRNLGKFLNVVQPDAYIIPVDARFSNPPADSAWAKNTFESDLPLLFEYRGLPPEKESKQETSKQETDASIINQNNLIATALAALMAAANDSQVPRDGGPTPGTM